MPFSENTQIAVEGNADELPADANELQVQPMLSVYESAPAAAAKRSIAAAPNCQHASALSAQYLIAHPDLLIVPRPSFCCQPERIVRRPRP